jgi:hypothetical protein
MMNKLAVTVVLVAGALACGRKEADQKAPVAGASAVTTASAAASTRAATSASAATDKPTSLPAELVQATLTAWVDAQNRNSFEDYKVLYGEPFVGIKRVGEVEKQFLLPGWLEDRRQLFQRNPLVTVENVKVMTTASTAIVEFDQTWKTARFQDFGRKRLVLNRDPKDGKLRIGREEMLTSNAGAAKITRPELPAGTHYFIKKTTGGFGAVLGLMGQAKATGKVTSVDFGHAQRAVNLDTAKRASQMVGSEIDVYSESGKPCSTKIVGIVAIAEAFIMVDEEDPNVPQQVWDLAGTSGTFLVADLRPATGTCSEPLWGRLSSLPKPTVYETRKATTDEVQRAIVALDRTAQGRDAQKTYLEWKQRPSEVANAAYAAAHWYEAEPETTVKVVTNPATQESYITIELSALGGPCGGLYALAMFKITDQELIEITPQWPAAAARDVGYSLWGFLPEGAAQLAESPQLVLFNGNLLYAHNGTGWVPAKHASGPRMMCGC